MGHTRIAGLMMVKDEADIVRVTIKHLLLQGVEHVYVMDNGSTDGTLDILDGYRRDGAVTLIEDDEVGYYQSAKMSNLAALARSHGYTWAIPCDADEIWLAASIGTIHSAIRSTGGLCDVVLARVRDHYATALDDEHEPNPVKRLAWANPLPNALPKVAVRLQDGLVIEQGNHSATVNGRPCRPSPGALEIRHFPYRSADQFVRKAINGAAAYAATDLPDEMGAHWRMYGQMIAERGEQAARDWFRQHFFWDDPSERLVFDPVIL